VRDTLRQRGEVVVYLKYLGLQGKRGFYLCPGQAADIRGGERGGGTSGKKLSCRPIDIRGGVGDLLNILWRTQDRKGLLRDCISSKTAKKKICSQLPKKDGRPSQSSFIET